MMLTNTSCGRRRCPSDLYCQQDCLVRSTTRAALWDLPMPHGRWHCAVGIVILSLPLSVMVFNDTQLAAFTQLNAVSLQGKWQTTFSRLKRRPLLNSLACLVQTFLFFTKVLLNDLRRWHYRCRICRQGRVYFPMARGVRHRCLASGFLVVLRSHLSVVARCGCSKEPLSFSLSATCAMSLFRRFRCRRTLLQDTHACHRTIDRVSGMKHVVVCTVGSLGPPSILADFFWTVNEKCKRQEQEEVM